VLASLVAVPNACSFPVKTGASSSLHPDSLSASPSISLSVQIDIGETRFTAPLFSRAGITSRSVQAPLKVMPKDKK
jgi:hypothetical protein